MASRIERLPDGSLRFLFCVPATREVIEVVSTPLEGAAPPAETFDATAEVLARYGIAVAPLEERERWKTWPMPCVPPGMEWVP